MPTVEPSRDAETRALLTGAGMLFLSNKVCIGPPPDTVVPESPVAALLAGSAILTVGLALFWHRRRLTALAPAA